MAAVSLARADVLAYRYAAQGLHRDTGRVAELAILDIGVQETGPEAARLAFDARLTSTPPVEPAGPKHSLALVWSYRGAPHLHRRRDLAALAGVMWPVADADALARLGETGTRLKKGGRTGLEGFADGVGLMRRLIRKPAAKGTASTALSAEMSGELGRYCRVCQVTHISELVMRMCSVPAGIELEPGTSPPVLVPGGSFHADGPDVPATQALIRAYLTLLGPAGPSEVAGYLNGRRSDIAAIWPDDLVQVSVVGSTGWVTEASVRRLRQRPDLAGDDLRLLGPFDPWLQARDRVLIVPDQSRHKALWPVLGRPGVVLLGGEVVAMWRPRTVRSKVEITVEEFVPLPRSAGPAIESEAARVAAVRGQELSAIR